MGINFKINKLRNDLVGIINESELPVSVIRLVLNEVINSISKIELDVVDKERKEWILDQEKNNKEQQDIKDNLFFPGMFLTI